MSSLFNIISFLYIFRSAQLLVKIWREWADIVQEPLTHHKKHLAEQSAYFLAVPVSVFFHEFAHALAIWFFGGKVISFNYRFFWGYVEHAPMDSPVEQWVISLAGTVGSLLFGLGIWLALRHNRASSLRYFGLRAFRFQIYFSLLYYPIFSFILPIGDWRVIYDFSATPILSSVTLVVHVIFLILYWRYDKQGSFEAPATESVAEQMQFEKLEQEVAQNPHDTQLQLQYVDMLRRGSANNRAKTQLTQFLNANPNSAAAYLELAAIEAGKSREISKKTSGYAAQALQLGLSNPYQIAAAQRMVAQYNLGVGNVAAALQAYEQAIQAINNAAMTPQQINTLATLYHERSLAYRRLQQYELAYADIAQAISLAQQSGQADLTAVYQGDLAVLENHAGHKLGNVSNW
ncbi:MAG: M50 family metallopeptidase [Anaerolineae bacterium]|nr:M50 family metallopeptidase [Anaerolineae bacterium]